MKYVLIAVNSSKMREHDFRYGKIPRFTLSHFCPRYVRFFARSSFFTALAKVDTALFHSSHPALFSLVHRLPRSSDSFVLKGYFTLQIHSTRRSRLDRWAARPAPPASLPISPSSPGKRPVLLGLPLSATTVLLARPPPPQATNHDLSCTEGPDSVAICEPNTQEQCKTLSFPYPFRMNVEALEKLSDLYTSAFYACGFCAVSAVSILIGSKSVSFVVNHCSVVTDVKSSLDDAV